MTLPAALALAAGLALAPALGAEQVRMRVGNAFDAESGAPLYREVHHETVADGRVVAGRVRYLDPLGEVFAEKTVRFDGSPVLPAFALENARTGHAESATPADGGLLVRFREGHASPLEQDVVVPPPGAIADAGFDRFIERHWDSLLAGDTVRMPFLVPSRLGFVDFRVRPVDGEEATGTATFVMEVDSALLRLVVSPMTVVYDRATKRLLRYEGLSNLRDERGDNPRVRIEFDYGARLSARGPD